MNPKLHYSDQRCNHGVLVGKNCPYCFTVLRVGQAQERLTFVDFTDFVNRVRKAPTNKAGTSEG